jgi:putative FmdB family regulatory protein
MPIYEYRCLDCGHQFELMQKFSDPPAETCTSCSGTVQKLISRSAFHLKGSGWYATDYGRNGSAKDKAADKNDSESSDTKSSDTKSSDTKSPSDSSGSASTESSSTGSASPESTKSSTTSSAA